MAWSSSDRNLAQTFPATMRAHNTLFYFCSNSFFIQCSNLLFLQQLFLICCIKQFKIASTFNIAADIILNCSRCYLKMLQLLKLQQILFKIAADVI